MSKSVAKKDQKSNPKTTTPIGKKCDDMRALIIEAVKCQRVVDKKSGGVSNKLLELAKVYQPKTSIGHISLDERSAEGFVDACKMHEDFIKSKDAMSNQCDKLPRCWTQAKSNIKAAINFGIDLASYASESALRKAVAKMRKAQAGTDPVKEALSAFKKEIEALPADTAVDLMAQITELAKQAIAALVPNEPINLDAEVVIEQVAIAA